jgi:hypothetical protein
VVVKVSRGSNVGLGLVVWLRCTVDSDSTIVSQSKGIVISTPLSHPHLVVIGADDYPPHGH